MKFLRGLIENKIEEEADNVLREMMQDRLEGSDLIFQQTMMPCPTCGGKGRGEEFIKYWNSKGRGMEIGYSSTGSPPMALHRHGLETCYTCMGKGYVERA